MKSVQLCAVIVVAAGGVVGVAAAQTTTEVGGAVLRFEVYNPLTNSWASSLGDSAPGQQIEFRAVLSYTGTRTDLFALGEVLYQPTISNVDNTGTGAQADQLGTWRNGGNGGNSVAGSMLTQAEGILPGPILSGYGRVGYGGTAATATGSNTMTSFRHVNNSDAAPDGSWIRMAGNFVTLWPGFLPIVPSAGDTNRILRGISAQQQSRALNSTYHIAGTQDLVLFRQALILSDDGAMREIHISSIPEAFRRVANTGTDDTRFISWQTSASDSGSHRTLTPTILPATIWVNVPSPGVGGVVMLAFARAVRRRRRS